MKKMILMLALFVAVSHTQSHAQVRVNINIGSQPVWGPAGYDYVDYYYLPDYDMYYNVPARQWVYLNGGRWVTTTVLPGRYRNIDLYRSYKVVINDRDPYRRGDYYRNRYAGFRGRHDQLIIRDSRDRKYYANQGRPRPNQWNNGNHRGNNNHGNDRHDHNNHNDHHDHKGGRR